MGRALNRATLPRDASGQVDLNAVDRSLASLIGSVPRRSTRRARSAILIQDLAALGGVPAPAAGTNGHAAQPVAAPVRVATVAPVSTPDPGLPGRIQPTDVRGIGRVLPAPVRPEDIEGSASMRAPSAPPPSDPPAIETAAEDAVVVVREEVDLESLPPLDARGAASEDTPRDPLVPSSLLAPVEPLPSTPPAPVVVAPTPPPSPPTIPPAPARRPTQASIPAVSANRASILPVNAPSVAPAEVGAVFDAFLGSAPVEPPPRPAPPPLSIPRAVPSASGLPRRPLTMQVPIVRAPSSAATAVTSGTLPRVPGATPPPPPVAEAVEALEVDDVVEVEEVALAPMLSRPPALPPLPPKKR